jgi:transposase
MNPRALGWDIHRKFSMVSLMEISAAGEIRAVERARLEHANQEAMRAWLSRLDPEIPVAVEAAFGWPWVADMLEALGHPVHLGHPPALKVLAQHEAKTDRRDSDRLGKFQLRGILPESYLAPPEVRQIRERTRYRMALSRLRSGVKSRLQAILHRLGVLHPFSDLFGKRGRGFLRSLELAEASRRALDGYLDLLDAIQTRIDEVEEWMVTNLAVDEIVRLLMTIPGVGLILAHVIRAEIGEIGRFPSRRHLAAYTGLAPLSNQSNTRDGPRHCSPACNHILRWALIEAAGNLLHTKRQAFRLKRLYARLTHGGLSNKNQAKVAVARELLEVVHVVWRRQVPYSESPPPRPGSVAAKRNRPQECPKSNTTLRPDQPRFPMARRRPSAVGQTRL